MNRLVIVFFILLFLILFFSCRENKASENKIAVPSSELAVLMRKMTTHCDSLKFCLENDLRRLPAFPPEFNKMPIAKRTDPEIRQEAFEGLAKYHLNTWEKLYTAKISDRKEAYSTIVRSCISCHESVCPGPLKRIKALKLNSHGE